MSTALMATLEAFITTWLKPNRLLREATCVDCGVSFTHKGNYIKRCVECRPVAMRIFRQAYKDRLAMKEGREAAE